MLQAFVNGLSVGLVIALLALGFQFVYLPTRVFHVAAAGLYVLAPYLVLFFWQLSNSWSMAISMALVIIVLMSVFCELLNHRRLDRKKAAQSAHLISSLGIFIVLTQLATIFWGSDTQSLRGGIDVFWNVGDLILTRSQLVSIIIPILIFIVTWVVFSNMPIGVRFRALSDNQEEFALMRFNIIHYRIIAFAVSGFFVGIAALLTANDSGFEPYSGLHAMLLAVAAVIIGGRYSYMGPVIGGILIGILRSQVVFLWSAAWQDIVTFLLLALFLYFRPQGLFNTKTRQEARL